MEVLFVSRPRRTHRCANNHEEVFRFSLALSDSHGRSICWVENRLTGRIQQPDPSSYSEESWRRWNVKPGTFPGCPACLGWHPVPAGTHKAPLCSFGLLRSGGWPHPKESITQSFSHCEATALRYLTRVPDVTTATENKKFIFDLHSFMRFTHI